MLVWSKKKWYGQALFLNSWKKIPKSSIVRFFYFDWQMFWSFSSPLPLPVSLLPLPSPCMMSNMCVGVVCCGAVCSPSRKNPLQKNGYIVMSLWKKHPKFKNRWYDKKKKQKTKDWCGIMCLTHEKLTKSPKSPKRK